MLHGTAVSNAPHRLIATRIGAAVSCICSLYERRTLQRDAGALSKRSDPKHGIRIRLQATNRTVKIYIAKESVIT